jgi:inner membrane protein COX18
VETLSEGLLDLAIALPLPPSWPPYASTIILATVATRLVLNAPFSVWVSQRGRPVALHFD